jgi:hypothetical protein
MGFQIFAFQTWRMDITHRKVEPERPEVQSKNSKLSILFLKYILLNHPNNGVVDSHIKGRASPGRPFFHFCVSDSSF